MKKRLREQLKKIKIVHQIGILINKVYFGHIHVFIDLFNGWKRRKFGSNYSKLKKFKNLYKGKRCFVVCTGPSLTYDDLELIKNEYSFGMNSITKIFDKTDFRPTFYGIQDIYVYEKMQNDVLNCGLNNIFIGSNILKKGYAVPDEFIVYPLSLYGHQYSMKKSKFRFSDDITINVFDG